jgi:hypothetical protein
MHWSTPSVFVDLRVLCDAWDLRVLCDAWDLRVSCDAWNLCVSCDGFAAALSCGLSYGLPVWLLVQHPSSHRTHTSPCLLLNTLNLRLPLRPYKLQVCLFDLDYGLPVQVRDTALGIEKEEIPESEVGKEFQLQEQINKGQTESSFGGGSGAASDMLLRLQRTAPYYKVCVRTL